jgi:hypothetical protein
VRDGDPRRFLVRDLLCLGVEAGAIGLARRQLGVLDQLLEAVVAPARDVAAALDRGAAEQRDEEGRGRRCRPTSRTSSSAARRSCCASCTRPTRYELGANADLLPIGLISSAIRLPSGLYGRVTGKYQSSTSAPFG